jgi:hypothetical protein
VIVPQINVGSGVGPTQAVETGPGLNTANTTIKTEHKPGTEAGAHGDSDHADKAVAEGGEHPEAAHGVAFTDLDQQLSRQRVNTFFGIYYCMTGLHGVHVLVGMALIFWIAYRAGTTKQKAWILPMLPLGIGAYLLFLKGIHLVIPTPDGIKDVGNAMLISGIVFIAIGGLWLAMRVVSFAKKPVLSGDFNETYYAPVDLVGLYWHLVDLIWIFLFPLLYLIHGRIGS